MDNIKKDEQGQKLNRRNFIKGATAVGIAAAAGLSAAGCSTDTEGDADAGADAGADADAGTDAGDTSSGEVKVFEYDTEAKVPATTADINRANVDPVPTVEPPSAYDYETDILIIGFGNGGTMAALECVEQGVPCIAIETSKEELWDEHAGTHNLAGAGGQKWAEARGNGQTWSDEDVPKLVDQIMLANDMMVRREIIEKHVESWDIILNKLEDIGCKFDAVDLSDSFEVEGEAYHPVSFVPVSNDLQNFTPSDPWVNKYHAVEQAIYRVVTDAGNEVLFDTRAINLIQDGDGAVLGAKVLSEGEEKFIGAKKTIISTGGFGANPDMCKATDYITDFCGCFVGPSTNVGDGIRLGQGAGGNISNMAAIGSADGGPDAFRADQPWLFREYDWWEEEGRSCSAYTRAIIQLCRQPTLKVNTEGKRFMDENGTWQAKTQGAFAQPGHYFFTIFGSNIEEMIEYVKSSRYGMCENMITPDFRVFFNDEEILPLWDWQDTIEEDARFESVYEADTLEELAELAGINPDNLVETVERYNEYCASGVDEEWGKHKDFLFPIDTPPYIAVFSKPAFLWVTQGGLVVNDRWQVLNEDGTAPIPNLYCGSSDTAGDLKPFSQGMETPFQQASAAIMNGYLAATYACEDL